jgi:hypothetical protein
MSNAIAEKKKWSKRRPGTTPAGFTGTAGRIAIVDIVLPHRVVLSAEFSGVLERQRAFYAKSA